MSLTSDGPVRVLVDDQEVVLDGIDAAVALIREGRIDGSTRVSLPGSRTWQTAASVPELARHIAQDPWAAWDQLEADPTEGAALTEPAAGGAEAPELEGPTEEGTEPALTPEPVEDEATAPTAAPLEELPVDAVRSMAPSRGGRMVVDTPRRTTTTPGRSGKVIAFPGGGGGAAAAVASLPVAAISDVQPPPAPTPLPAMELPSALPAPASAPQASASATRWWRVALIGGAAVTIMLITQWYITSTATAVFPPAVRTPPATTAVPPGPVAAPVEVVSMRPPPAAAGQHEALETRLRAQMPDVPQDISRPGQLEDALLIELTRMHVPTTSIRAPVLTWAGRRDDVPQSAEMHIRYRSVPGELERELGAVGLVVGRYVHTYALEVPALDVVIEREGTEPRQLAIDPSAAQRFYLKRTDLKGFLESMR